MQTQLHVAIDVGSQQHRVAIGWAEGDPIEEFDCPHTPAGLNDFFSRIRKHEDSHHAEVCVAMEGYGGYWRNRFHPPFRFKPEQTHPLPLLCGGRRVSTYLTVL